MSQIKRGTYGEITKVMEEAHEALDADAQGAKVMVLQELSDIIGAVQGYLEKHAPGYTLEDLIRMSHITRHVFESGHRKAQP